MAIPLSFPSLGSKSDLLARDLSKLHQESLHIADRLYELDKAILSPAFRAFTKGYLEQNNWQICRLLDAIEYDHPCNSESSNEGIESLVDNVMDARILDAPPVIRDAALSGTLLRLIHCRIASFRSAQSLASQLNKPEIADMLQASLDDEETAAERLNAIETEKIDPSAARFTEPMKKRDTGIFG